MLPDYYFGILFILHAHSAELNNGLKADEEMDVGHIQLVTLYVDLLPQSESLHNLPYENEFELPENYPVGKTHFSVIVSHKDSFSKERQTVTWNGPFVL